MVLVFFNCFNDSWFGCFSLEFFWDFFESFELVERFFVWFLVRDVFVIVSIWVDWLEIVDLYVFKVELLGMFVCFDFFEFFFFWNVVCFDMFD